MQRTTTVAAAAIIAFTMPIVTHAGVRYSAGDGRYVELGGRLQVQYHRIDPNVGATTDELLLRRLRPYIKAGDGGDWRAKIQWDMGKETVDIRDAYFAYTGWDIAAIYIGNYFTPYSRESMTSSKTQQLVERTLVGDHNYGVTDRQVGIHLEGELAALVWWGASLAKAAIDPDNSRIDFDTVASLDRDDDWSEGDLAVLRVDWHPLGLMAFDQGDFTRELRMTVGAAGYVWSNDGDNLDPARARKDLDEAAGFEVSAGLRGGGFSIDVEYNRIQASLVEAGVTAGLYVDSDTTLEAYAIEGGYMIVPARLELVAGYEAQDADGYADTWTRTSVGANWFVRKQDIKLQATYRVGENLDGDDARDADELFVQMQYVF